MAFEKLAGASHKHKRQDIAADTRVAHVKKSPAALKQPSAGLKETPANVTAAPLDQYGPNAEFTLAATLRENFKPKRLYDYDKAMATVITNPAERESVATLQKYLRDPQDTYNISPVMQGKAVVGGAHTQIAPAPRGAAPNRYGSLELAWGTSDKAIGLAIGQGVAALKDKRGAPVPGIFADVANGAANAEAMKTALHAAGFKPFYAGAQPPLEAGKPEMPVTIYYRPASPETAAPTAAEAKTYFDAYWSSFDGISGDRAKLEASPAYQKLLGALNKNPSAPASQSSSKPNAALVAELERLEKELRDHPTTHGGKASISNPYLMRRDAFLVNNPSLAETEFLVDHVNTVVHDRSAGTRRALGSVVGLVSSEGGAKLNRSAASLDARTERLLTELSRRDVGEVEKLLSRFGDKVKVDILARLTSKRGSG